MAISEDASRDYNKTDWSPGMPITEGRMDNIETGIDVNREAIQALDTALTTNVSTIGSQITALNSTVDGYSASNTIKSAIDDLRGRIGAIGTGSADGTAALTQIINALTNSEAVKYNDLKARLDTIEDMKKLFGKKLDPDDQTGTTYIDAFNTTDSTVYATITGLYNTISNLSGLISTNTSTVAGLATKITEATNYYTDPNLKVFNTLAERMNSLDDRITANYNWIDTAKGDDETLAEHIARIYNDVINAHTSSIVKHTENGSEVDTTFNSLDERFETDEANIRSNAQAITSLTQDTISIQNGGIIDTFDSHDTDKALSANRGRILRNIIGGSYTGDGNSTVANAIATAQANAQTYSDNNKVAKADVYNDLDYEPAQDATADKVLDARQGKALKDLIDDLDTDYQAADRAIDTRLVSVEDELDNARIQIGTDEDTQEPIMSTLDQRLDSMDTTAAGIRADLTTVITELGMTDTNGLKTIGTRVDDLADNITALATELDMQMSEGKITDTQSRIDDLAYDISHTVTQEDNTVGLTQRIITLETDLDTAENNIVDLDTRLDALDGGQALVGNNTLISRVTALEGKDTIVVDKPNSGSNYTDEKPNSTAVSTPSTDADYLIADDDGKYFYWRYFGPAQNQGWQLISGAGGSGAGTSSAAILAELPATNVADENIDYYIGNSNTGFTHYRYYNNEYIEILPKNLVNNIGVTQNGGLTARDIGSATNKLSNFVALKTVSMTENKESEAEDAPVVSYTITFVDTNGEQHSLTLAAGGGSGSSSLSTAILNRIGDANITTITGKTCELSYTYYATDNSGDPLATPGKAVWYINRAQVATSDAKINNLSNNEDYNTFDITQYLNIGENNITLEVTSTIDNIPVIRNKTWVIDMRNFSLEWDYDESHPQEGENIEFSCIPYGVDINKTLHLKIGLIEVTKSIITSGIPTSISTENIYAHGAYTAEMWMTAIINGQEESTTPIFHDFIVVEEGNEAPIIAATLPDNTINQYDTISIPFVVYTPNNNISNVTLAVDGVVQDSREVNRSTQIWHYTPLTVSNDAQVTSVIKVLTITSGTITKTLNLTVKKVQIKNEEISGYAFKLKANELPSNNALKAWYYDNDNQNETKLQFSNNFDWINGGIQTELDENNQLRQFIRIKSGTTMTIPYKMFYPVDPHTTGCSFKIIFKIENCRDYDANIINNIADNVGIELNAHNATFKSSTTTITTQYGEDEYIELEFEVYDVNTENPFMIAWIDGVMTTARSQTADEGSFMQTQEHAKNITIGSNDCDVCIYLVKYYTKKLTINDHITNFIADAPNASEMVRRYNRNDILGEDSEIDPNKLARNNKDCRVWLYDIERMTKAKDDAVTVYNFQQIWENGDKYYQLQGSNAKMKIQGTSSVDYRYGTANTDIDFGKKKAPNATLKDGYGNNLLSDELEYKGFKINDNSLPITYSNTKVNFASCEQVNNMCNAEWYQRYQPFPSLSARDCMEFAMGVQFIKDRHENEPNDGIILFSEKGEKFNPEKYYMYSIANMGTSKKNTHIFHSANEVCIEIKENTSDAQRMKSFDSDWVLPDHKDNYEIRYPDIGVDEFSQELKDGWARFVTWMAASNPNAATGNALAESITFEPYTFKGHNREITQVEGRNFAQVLQGVTISQYAGTYDHDTFEYRMAKMLSECEDYMAMDSIIYHFCFIERHTMVDNVAKNTFWSSVKEIGGPNDEEGYWIWDLSKNYDNDTADGNNNNGLLILDYGNEAADTYNGTPVFNGHDTVWFVFASNLYEACRAMFTNREAIGAWSSQTYHAYLTEEQRKIPERVWNQCYWYAYLRPFEYNIETSWITKLDGGQKVHQRNHFETYEEVYDSSKYRGSFSHNQSITLRGEALDYKALGLPERKSKFEITMFNKCYLTIWIGTNYETVKCEKGIPVTLSFYEKADTDNYLTWMPLANYVKGQEVNYGEIRYECLQNHTAQAAQTPDITTSLWKPVWLSLANSVINIDSGSMVQTIGDLSLIYPSSGQFGQAKRLRSLQIGSDIEGYYNPNMNSLSALTFRNKMLEYLYVQNLPQATYSLNLSECPELKYLDASNSGFTGFVFANGGLLNEAYLNNPRNLIMRNLNYLTNENFHLAQPTAVTSLRLEGGTLFDNYTFINQVTNLTALRLTNINWTLNTNDLLDRLLRLQGINEDGTTSAQSYLAGNIDLTGTVYEGVYNAYNAAWSPDLIISHSHAYQWIAQYLVTYVDTDEKNTVLYEQYIDTDKYLTDPYNSLSRIPTKDSDIRYRYIFGETDSFENYIPFSGWRLEDSSESIYREYNTEEPQISLSGPTTLYAVYSTIDQQYRVRWVVNNIEIAVSDPQNYGGGYSLVAPTIKEVQAKTNTFTFQSLGNGNCSYSIMTGWDKLPTNVMPNNSITNTYDIGPVWLERTNINYMTVLTSNEYSIEEKLLVLKQMSNARTDTTYNFSIHDLFPITMGYNGIKPGIELLNSPRRFNGTIQTINEYTPFAANTSFTMAIDYRFEYVTAATPTEAILISCYGSAGEGSIQGFKLFYNPQENSMSLPQISFGSTTTIGAENRKKTINQSITDRSIIVLRHRAGDENLYIYSGASASGLTTEYSSQAFRQSITWSAIPTNAKIILGGTNITNDANMMNATGMLFSVKYWEEDLGEGECVQLANWCHETISFAVSDYKEAEVDEHSALNDTLKASIVLHALNASEMGTIEEARLDNLNRPTTIGWDPSTIRTFYNNRIYAALPIALQSIISPVTIPFNKANYSSNEGGYIISAGANSALDYIFAPSCVEIGENPSQQITSQAHSIEANGTIEWHISSDITVKAYQNGGLEVIAGDADYTNLRFPYQYNRVDKTVTIYTNYPTTASSFQSWLSNNHSLTLKSGDILITNGEDSTAYIYATAQEAANGAPIIITNQGFLSCSSGGWIEAKSWFTRSVPNSIYANNNMNKFVYVKTNGGVMSGNSRIHGIVYSIGL